MPSPSLALAWKESRLARDVVLLVVAGHAALVIARRLAIAAGVTTVQDFAWLADPATACPLVAFWVAMFAAAMLFAGERRQGTWGWHALLPVAWWNVLAVKLTVIVAAGFAAAAGAGLVCLVAGGLPDGAGVADVLPFPALEQAVIAGLVAMSLVCVTCLAGLFVAEPLLAVVASVGWHLMWFALLGAVGSWLGRSLPGWQSPFAGGEPAGHARVLVMLVAGCPLVIGTAALPSVFRRAWRRADERDGVADSAVAIGGLGETVPFIAAVQSRTEGWRPWRSPAGWWALAWSSLELTWTAPLIGVAAGVSTAATAAALARLGPRSDSSDAWDTAITVGGFIAPVVTIVLAALQAIGGDQASGRVPWPAERGLSPWKVLAARALPMLVFVVVLGAVALVGLLPNERFHSLAALPIGWVLFAAATGFLGGIHCLATAMVWRSTLLAFAAGLVAALCSGIVWIAGMSHVGRSPALLAGFGDARFTPLASLVSWALPPLLLLIPLVLVRPWLRDDRALLKVRWGAAFVVLHAVWLAGCYTLA